MQCLESKILERKNKKHYLNYVRQANRETKENQRDKKGKMFLLFNKLAERLCFTIKAER